MWHHRISTTPTIGLLAFGLALFAAGGTMAQEAAVEQPTAVQDPDQQAAARTAKRCKIKISSAQSNGGRTFSATQILDLDLRVKLNRSVTGEHLLRLDLKTPKGHHYQTLTVAFSTEAASAGARRSVAGFPHPLEVRVTETAMHEGRPVFSVLAQLPVAGTPIVHSALYGRWTATAYLDDETEACGRPRRFFLEP